jgi:chemotaxis protein MotB
MAKKKCPEFENHERWLVAYADMMTLLFALFVVLYALLNVEMKKVKTVTQSVRRAFGMEVEEIPDAQGFPSGNSRKREDIFNKIRGNTSQASVATRNRRERAAVISADMSQVEKAIQESFSGTQEYPSVSGESSDRVVFFSKDPDGIRISLLARGFFSSGKPNLEPEAYRILDAIGGAVKGLGRIVRVEGHSDSSNTEMVIPFTVKDSLRITNWELSALRAAAVVRYFVDQVKVSRTQVYAAGFSDTRPVAPNDTPQNRSMNRRVDIKVLYETPTEQMDVDSETLNEEQQKHDSSEKGSAKEKSVSAPDGAKAPAPAAPAEPAKAAPSH